MERLRAAGINTDLVRIQQGVHNKGFVVDHRKTVVIKPELVRCGRIGQTRDAGLIIDNATIAQYFEKIFVHDWDNVAVGRSSRSAKCWWRWRQ